MPAKKVITHVEVVYTLLARLGERTSLLYTKHAVKTRNLNARRERKKNLISSNKENIYKTD